MEFLDLMKCRIAWTIDKVFLCQVAYHSLSKLVYIIFKAMPSQNWSSRLEKEFFLKFFIYSKDCMSVLYLRQSISSFFILRSFIHSSFFFLVYFRSLLVKAKLPDDISKSRLLLLKRSNLVTFSAKREFLIIRLTCGKLGKSGTL